MTQPPRDQPAGPGQLAFTGLGVLALVLLACLLLALGAAALRAAHRPSLETP